MGRTSEDGTTKIFLNTEGIPDDISGDLKAFLDYLGGRKSDNDFVKKLDEEVKMAKQNREWRREYMTLIMRDRENIEKGIEQGLELGLEQGKLVSLKSLIKSTGWTITQAMDALKFSAEDREKYTRTLNN